MIRLHRNRCQQTWLLAMCTGILMLGAQALPAQQLPAPNGHWSPLNQTTPPGVVSYWAGLGGRITPGTIQAVEVQLPSTGKVTFYSGNPITPVTRPAPAQAGFLVGYVYRVQISQMPEYPGVELYPTVELIDHLHPPRGREHLFSVPVQITGDEIEAVLAGRMVTKAVYLEQPQLAIPAELDPLIGNETVPATSNLLMEADRRGRPMAIIRLGSRLPNPHRPDPAFFGNGLPVHFPPALQPPALQPPTP